MSDEPCNLGRPEPYEGNKRHCGAHGGFANPYGDTPWLCDKAGGSR